MFDIFASLIAPSHPLPDPIEREAASPARKRSRQTPIALRERVDELRSNADLFSRIHHLLLLNETLYRVFFWGRGYEGEAYLLVDLKGNKQILKIPKDAGSNEGTLSAIAAKLECYYRLKSAEFPIATHYNLEPLCTRPEFLRYCQIEDSAERHAKIKDFVENYFKDGYYLVQYIPYSFPEPRDDLPESKREFAIYDKLRSLFKTLFRLGIAADFDQRNIGFLKRDDPESLCYCDPFPIVEDPMAEEAGNFSVMLPARLRSFTSEGSSLWHFLDPRGKS